MYAAEMCYWITLIDSDTDIDFSPKAIGQQLAQQYISLADGPLKHSSWNTEQAVNICNQLQAAWLNTHNKPTGYWNIHVLAHYISFFAVH